jgi:hypothetical protein
MEENECKICGRRTRLLYSADGEAHPVCAKHYQGELETDLEMWNEKYGHFCLECDQPLHRFVLAHKSLPGLCVKHLAREMRKDGALAERVRAAFDGDLIWESD